MSCFQPDVNHVSIRVLFQRRDDPVGLGAGGSGRGTTEGQVGRIIVFGIAFWLCVFFLASGPLVARVIFLAAYLPLSGPAFEDGNCN